MVCNLICKFTHCIAVVVNVLLHSFVYIYDIVLLPVPSDPVQNVMVKNVTDDTIAVMISWDPPFNPNGFIQYYRVEFQLIPDNSSGCEVALFASEVTNSFDDISGTSEALTSLLLDGLG